MPCLSMCLVKIFTLLVREMKSPTDFISAITKSSSQEVISKQKKSMLEKSAFSVEEHSPGSYKMCRNDLQLVILFYNGASLVGPISLFPALYTMQILVQGQSCFNQWAWHVAQCESEALQLWCEADWFKRRLGKVPLLQIDAKRGKTSVTIYNNVTKDIKDNRKRSRQ